MLRNGQQDSGIYLTELQAVYNTRLVVFFDKTAFENLKRYVYFVDLSMNRLEKVEIKSKLGYTYIKRIKNMVTSKNRDSSGLRI